jgi:abnormal spindle-like microcephaly-associated protein
VKARRLEFEILHESAETRAATAIQAAWRGWTCRMDFAMLRYAAVKAQAFARGAAARRRLAEKKHVSAKYAVARDAVAVPAPARVAAAPPSRSRLANVATAASRRVGGGTTGSASLLAWSAASSVAASSDSEADDDDETPAYDTPAYERGPSRVPLTNVSPVSNASQDLSRFDSFPLPDEYYSRADEYCGYEGNKQDAGFAAAAAAAEKLAGARSVGDVRRALSALASATRASGGAREAASSPRALHSLLRVMRRCDRSEGHSEVLRLAHDVLETLSGDESGPARAVFDAKDAVTVVTEHMQMCRDRFELVGAAARTLTNLCGDAARARAVARAERGRVTRRVRGICEILGNTLAARRQNDAFSRRARESAESGQDAFRNQHQADRAEARSTRALEATVRSMRELVDRLERFEGEVRYEPALASRRATEAPSLGAEDDEPTRKKKPAPAFSLDAVTTRFAEASKRESSFRVSVEPEPEPEPLAVSARSPRRRVREKKTRDEDVSRRRRPLASSRGNGFGRRETKVSIRDDAPTRQGKRLAFRFARRPGPVLVRVARVRASRPVRVLADHVPAVREVRRYRRVDGKRKVRRRGRVERKREKNVR